MYLYLVTVVTLVTSPTDHTGLGIQANQQLALYLGVFTPLIVALITKKLGTSSKVKASLLLVFNLIVGFLTELLGQGDFHFWSAVNGVILASITGVIALFGFYMPTKINDTLQGSLRKDDPPAAPPV